MPINIGKDESLADRPELCMQDLKELPGELLDIEAYPLSRRAGKTCIVVNTEHLHIVKSGIASIED